MAVAAILGALGGHDESQGLAPSIAALLSTPALAAHVAWRALRSDRPVVSVLVRATGAGVLNVTLATALVAASMPGVLARLGAVALVLVPVGLVAATVLASPLGGGLGLAFGIALAPLVARIRDDLASLDLGAPARTAIACGAWLLAVAALSTGLAVGGIVHAALSATVCASLGGVLVGGGAIARLHRSGWLARVERGTVEGWAIVARAEVEVDDELPLFDRGRIGDRVLVRIEERGDGAYRTARAHVAHASLPDGAG